MGTVLVPTKILDVFSQGTEEEDAGETVDRVSWERKASVESLKVMEILVSKIRTVEPSINPNYTKYYIGLASSSGPARNFVTFRPKKSDYVLTHFKIPEDEDLTSDLVETGLDILKYDSGNYRVRVYEADLEKHGQTFMKLINRARQAYTIKG